MVSPDVSCMSCWQSRVSKFGHRRIQAYKKLTGLACSNRSNVSAEQYWRIGNTRSIRKWSPRPVSPKSNAWVTSYCKRPLNSLSALHIATRDTSIKDNSSRSGGDTNLADIEKRARETFSLLYPMFPRRRERSLFQNTTKCEGLASKVQVVVRLKEQLAHILVPRLVRPAPATHIPAQGLLCLA